MRHGLFRRTTEEQWSAHLSPESITVIGKVLIVQAHIKHLDCDTPCQVPIDNAGSSAHNRATCGALTAGAGLLAHVAHAVDTHRSPATRTGGRKRAAPVLTVRGADGGN